MRIMLVVNEFPPEKIAGTAMATRSLAKHLSLRGHRVRVVVTTPCPEEKRAEIEPHDYELIWFPACRIKGLGWLWRIWHGFRQSQAFHPDVIQGQAVSCGLIAGVIGRVSHIPSICYAQGYDVYQASLWQKRTEIHWGCSWPDRCLAVTENLRQAIADIVDIPVSLMPHAFELPETLPDRESARRLYELECDKKVILCVARLEHFKGHDILLRAWKACADTHPSIELWIAGCGSMQAQLETLAKALGIHKSVRFLGHLPQRAIHTRMQAADLFVLPSRSEPFGIVLLEAMAHGLPVVASDVGGIPEVLPDIGARWTVPPEDEHALAHALRDAIENGDCPSEENRKHALRFVWEKHVLRFEEIYQQLAR